ncbi:unnamed protein product, partial [Medioppia subpectinata]
MSVRCNHIPECLNGADEQNCKNYNCMNGYKKCDSGQCIP